MYARDIATEGTIENTAMIDPDVPDEGSYTSFASAIPTERKNIKNGSLTLLVNTVDEVVPSITTLASQSGGYVEASSFAEYTQGQKSGNMTLRVPADHFDTLILAIKNLALRVENENVSSSDVATQIVDLEANLKALHAEEDQYLDIMKRAGAIKDVLLVSERLASVRSRIEQTQGQMNYLSRQVAMSTLHISLRSEANPQQVASDWRITTVTKAALKGMFASIITLINIIIVIVIWLPALLLQLAFLGVIVWVLWRLGMFIATKLFGGPIINPFKKQ
jgi:type IV secretory pathway VirB2 component (pilin)